MGRSTEDLDALPRLPPNSQPPLEAAPSPPSTSTSMERPYSARSECTSFVQPFWRPVPTLSLRRRIALYKALSKFRLSSLVILTAMGGYTMVPAASLSLAFSLPNLLSTALGTLLCAASTNTVNQILEAPYDAQMARTRGRPLVRRIVTPLHATVFASLTGVSGVALLATFVNPLTASLGLLNILLYAFVYTPLKRLSIVNTWVGAVVGAIPPLMGWAAVTGSIDPMTQPGRGSSSSSSSLGSSPTSTPSPIRIDATTPRPDTG